MSVENLPPNYVPYPSFLLITSNKAYGAEAGVAALKWLPYGGLYLCGGLTPKNIKLITGLDGKFMDAFGDKVRIIY